MSRQSDSSKDIDLDDDPMDAYERELLRSVDDDSLNYGLPMSLSAMSLPQLDLPIQYRRDLINMWQKAHTQAPKRQKAPAMVLFIMNRRSEMDALFHGRNRHTSDPVDEEPKRRSRFDNLDPEILLQRLSRSREYYFIRDLSLQKLYSEIHKKLRICARGIGCQERVDLPHRVFSWTRDDFLSRRRIKTCVWIDLLIKNVSPTCLELKKFKCDFDEFERFVEMILGGSLEEHLATFNRDVMEPVRDAYRFLDIDETLAMELDENYNEVRKYLNEQIAMTLSRHTDSERTDLLLELERKTTEADLLDPIEVRYHLRHYGAVEEDLQHRFFCADYAMHKKLKELQKQTEKERYCSQCTLNTYYMDVEKYKARIAALTEKYEKEFEIIDNEITNTKMGLDKMRQQEQFFKEQIERFHEEIEEELEGRAAENRLSDEAARLKRMKKHAEHEKRKRFSKK